MITIKVTMEDGNTFTTPINCTFEEAKSYYVGNYFNMGTVDDYMVKAVKVELINKEVN